MAKSKRLKWADSPAGHDYPAATSYLSLIASPTLAEVLSSLLAQSAAVEHPVKDILRAARLPLLPADDPGVAR
jgi:hypothetical protein